LIFICKELVINCLVLVISSFDCCRWTSVGNWWVIMPIAICYLMFKWWCYFSYLAKLVPLAYGIKKLQISTVVEDDKVRTSTDIIFLILVFIDNCNLINLSFQVSVDWLTETIQELEDLVQSVDIAAFNKI
jgi:translation elongation factor EF-1beta